MSTPYPCELGDLERWLVAAITEPTEPCASEVGERISASQTQSPSERLAVYRQAYVARLLDVLRQQFPCTRFAAGDDVFDRLTAGYLAAHPPYSYTLTVLGDQLEKYLDATRPPDWGEFIVELVRLEQAIARVFDAPGPEALRRFTMPASAHESLRLRLVPGFELLDFYFPVSTFYSDWKAAGDPDWPQASPQFVALFRRNYIVRRHELSPIQYELLRAIEGGFSLDEALRKSLAASGNETAMNELTADVHRWFTHWAASGFFASAN